MFHLIFVIPLFVLDFNFNNMQNMFFDNEINNRFVKIFCEKII